MIDGTESDEPWLPCRAPKWCAAFGDRFSASLINRRLPYVFKEGAFGMVLSSSAARISCSFFADGGTMTRLCPPGAKDCVPGCSNNDGLPHWCDDVSLTSQSVYGCAFRDRDLEWMLRHHEMRPGSFNELVIDPRGWSSDRPDPSIEAFFFIRDHVAGLEERRIMLAKPPRNGEAAARKFHVAYHRRFPQVNVPLVRLDLDHLSRPFTRVA